MRPWLLGDEYYGLSLKDIRQIEMPDQNAPEAFEKTLLLASDCSQLITAPMICLPSLGPILPQFSIL
jgi:hypothetical protein